MTFKYLGTNINRIEKPRKKSASDQSNYNVKLTRYNIKKQVYKLKQDKNIQNIMQYKYSCETYNDLCH